MYFPTENLNLKLRYDILLIAKIMSLKIVRLLKASVHVLPYLFIPLKPLIDCRGVRGFSIPGQQGRLVPEHTLEQD